MAYSQTDRLGVYSRRVDRDKEVVNINQKSENQLKRNSYSNGKGHPKRG